MADALGGAPDAGISTSSSDTDKERGERPDVDSAPVLSILKNEEDLPPRVSSCLAARVPAEPELAAEVINGSAEARVSLIRGCERVGSLVDGWLGSADKQCLEAVLSRASSLELDKMMSFLMNPDAGDIDSMSLTAQVEECRN